MCCRARPGVIFEELGFTFLGPFDGHDTQEMIEVFRKARQMEGPLFIQVITKKGQGCDFAEAEPTKFHGPGAYNPMTGELKKSDGPPNSPPSLARRWSSWRSATRRSWRSRRRWPRARRSPSFSRPIPDRFFDVGIAEQHAVTFAAGLACEGMKPVAAIYSTFLQRAFDQVIHDVCVQNLHVVFPIDRAGLVGEDGHTQQGVFDIAFLRMIPNMRVMAPKDENELRHMLYTALRMDGPVALRYPRGKGVGVPMDDDFHELPIGKAELLTPESEIDQAECAVLGYGHLVPLVEQAVRELAAEDSIRAVAVNARWAKPLDEELILRLARATHTLVTIEDGVVAGGFGSAVAELLHAHGLHDVRLKIIGLPDKFIEHGAPGDPARALRPLGGSHQRGGTRVGAARLGQWLRWRRRIIHLGCHGRRRTLRSRQRSLLVSCGASGDMVLLLAPGVIAVTGL